MWKKGKRGKGCGRRGEKAQMERGMRWVIRKKGEGEVKRENGGVKQNKGRRGKEVKKNEE